MILLSVSMTLLLLKNNLISFHQSSNFIQSLSNHSRSSTMFFGIPAYLFSFIVTAGAGAFNISSVSICLYLLEVSSMICKDPSYSNNISILFVLLKLVLVILRRLFYMCFLLNRKFCRVLSVYTSLAR